MKEFFGFAENSHLASGAYSWQHLTFVTALMAIMIVLAVLIGRRMRRADDKRKGRVLVWAAILIDAFEIFKIIIMGLRTDAPDWWTSELPLFLCSIQLFTIPLAAFSKGRVREAALDFVSIFGLLGAFLGTYAAAQNYSVYPVLSVDNVVSGITHAISGFTALYIMIAGMASMKKRNILITYGILAFFCAAALIANHALDYNYMFLRRGDGTPYDIVFNIVGGSPVLYPMMVIGLFLVYIAVFYWVYFQVRKHVAAKSTALKA